MDEGGSVVRGDKGADVKFLKVWLLDETSFSKVGPLRVVVGRGEALGTIVRELLTMKAYKRNVLTLRYDRVIGYGFLRMGAHERYESLKDQIGKKIPYMEIVQGLDREHDTRYRLMDRWNVWL